VGQVYFNLHPVSVFRRLQRLSVWNSQAGNGLYAERARVGQRYIRGRGVEFGALHTPLPVPHGVSVRYADLASADILRTAYADVGPIRAPDMFSDLEHLTGIEDESQDFIIANHVLEHVEDPLRALGSIARVLRTTGVAFLALPDKRFTFDRDREITSLGHLIKDRDEGPDGSLAAHYDEWCRCIDHLAGEAHKQKIAVMLQERSNIHFHVWDYAAMLEMFSYVVNNHEFGLDVELSVLNEIEVIWVLRKR
jgi:SAM-dependent methyltransferase